MSKHTPGPWKQHGTEIVGGMGSTDAQTVAFLGYGNRKHLSYLDMPSEAIQELAEANAHLIAAAPDLLEAAKATLQQNEWDWHNDGGRCPQCKGLRNHRKICPIAELEAAIAKAEAND